jgi:sulfide dehydrogenase [flavocytochrome c] flavoprotein subunit
VIILDDKAGFSKQSLFTQGWQMHYGDMIEWVSGEQGGKISGINPDTMTLMGELEEFTADVINIIPPQKAGAIAFAAGLTDDSGWCPVDQRTFESSIHKDIYVIGDASIAGKMPKSGYAANSQGKVCATAIVTSVNGQPTPEPSYVNTCYSVIAPKHGISVAAVYRLEGGQIVPVPDSGGISPLGASERDRALEAEYAYSWLKNITSDMFG